MRRGDYTVKWHENEYWLISSQALLDSFYLKKARENVYILLYKHPAHACSCLSFKEIGRLVLKYDLLF